MAERSGTRHTDNFLERLRNDTRIGLHARGHLGPCSHTLDSTSQLLPPLHHPGHTSPNDRRQVLHRRAPSVSVRIRRPIVLPSPRPRTPLGEQKKKRHRLLHGRRGQRQRRLIPTATVSSLAETGIAYSSPTSNFSNGTHAAAISAATHSHTQSSTMRLWTSSPTGKPQSPVTTSLRFSSLPQRPQPEQLLYRSHQPSYNTRSR